jgi:putative spermidine/putrescine transport system substrate-binding protein
VAKQGGSARWRRWLRGAAWATLAGLAAGRPAAAQTLDKLVAAARAEGQLTVIALPHDWCGYGELLAAFKARYGLAINELDPQADSAAELAAIRSGKAKKGAKVPDVIDAAQAFGPQAVQQKLLAPYKVATWDSIPAALKDPGGYWYGDYYGVLVFEINAAIVRRTPGDWPDLLGPDYRNRVALAGDPRGSTQAIMAVWAAGLSQAKGQADKAAAAGLQFFAELKRRGNLLPVIGKPATLAQGNTPILIRWDFNALYDRDSLNGRPPVQVVVPASGVVGRFYIQAISATAPHPNAARLWMEYLYSDEGQLGFLKGYCRPIRFDDLLKRKKIPPELLARLPPAAAYGRAVFPTVAQQASARDAIAKGWDKAVGANVR